jgi:pimeloyl-ACP methyl ester carboxylesterase
VITLRDGRQLEYCVVGASAAEGGQPALFCHGWGACGLMFVGPCLEAIFKAHGLQVFAPHAPGWGLSDLAPHHRGWGCWRRYVLRRRARNALGTATHSHFVMRVAVGVLAQPAGHRPQHGGVGRGHGGVCVAGDRRGTPGAPRCASEPFKFK